VRDMWQRVFAWFDTYLMEATPPHAAAEAVK
jgi:hypothetical protein